jgi:RNA polymerase sigma-70 factor (ECF subfamily)
MENEAFNEKELVERLRGNDPDAFRTLYEKYGPRLQAFSYRFNFSREEAEEIVQESFIRIWQARDTIDPGRSFNTFVVTIAKHLIYNQIRHSKYRDDYLRELKSGLKEPVSHPANGSELQQLVNKAMMDLPAKCRQVFRKSRLEGYSSQQIADEMNISRSTVENQLNKALKRIRGYIMDHGYKALPVIWPVIQLMFGGKP